MSGGPSAVARVTKTETSTPREAVGKRSGVEILWLSNSPFYGQTDAGAIWNRTINHTFTSSAQPHGCGFERCPQEPSVYGVNVGLHGDGQVNNTLYVDDGRLSWDPTDVARAKARCENNYHLAWAAFAGAADHAAHHGEQLVLYRALSALGGRSAKIAIVAFGHPACTDCFCLFKLLGDVVPKTSTVPAALCPRGLNHRNVGVDCCVYTLDW